MSHAPPRVRKQRRPQDEAFGPDSGSHLAGSPAWHGLPQCPGYGHCVFYCCVALGFGSGFHGNAAIHGWGLGCMCFGTGFGCTLPIVAGVCGVGLSFGFTPLMLAGVLGCVCLCALSACAPPVLAGLCAVCVCALVRVSAAPRHSWLGCWGLCVCLRAPPLTGQFWLGFLVCVSWFGLCIAPRQSWLGS